MRSKIGRIAVRWSRPIAGTSKTVPLSKEADGWYVAFSCAAVALEPLPLTRRETGIDVGLKVLLITADGQPVENPRHERTAEGARKKAQQRVSRRKQGSTRRRKAVQVLAKQHQHGLAAAERLPPHGCARPRASVGHHLRRGHATRALESPSTAEARRHWRL